MKPRKASTLMIHKKTPQQDNTVLMLLRHPGNAFVPSAWVFPGGALDKEDYALHSFCVQSNEQKEQTEQSARSKDKEILTYLIASIRETFEETGILYAYRENKLLSIRDDELNTFAEYREQLFKKEIYFKDILEKEELLLATDCLSYFDRWVTPALFPIRYDACFFYTDVVPEQLVKIDKKEVIQYKWISPAKAIEGYHSGNFPMVLPTISVLKNIF